MELFDSNFPQKIESESYVYGAFIKDNNHLPKISFIQNDDGLRPIGGTLRLEASLWFDHQEYISNLVSLLKGLRNKNSNDFYDQDDIEKIIDIESSRDPGRGEYAPYFRTLIFNWIKKTGVYPSHITYIGHIPGKDNCLTKHLFHVSECISVIADKPVYINQYSNERYIFDNTFAREDSVGMFTLPYVIDYLYKGQYDAYYKLLQELMIYYQNKGSSKERESKQKYSQFITEIQKAYSTE